MKKTLLITMTIAMVLIATTNESKAGLLKMAVYGGVGGAVGNSMAKGKCRNMAQDCVITTKTYEDLSKCLLGGK